MELSEPTLQKTKYGFYQFSPLPSRDTLAQYYAEKYYQEGKGSYDISYLSEEVDHFRLKADLVWRQIKRMRSGVSLKAALDVGCGEGWMLDCLFQEGLNVQGIDYSSFALDKFHPHLKPFLIQGDIYKALEGLKKENRKFDIIILLYVIEHVVDPVKLIDDLVSLLSAQGLLVVMAPNDFSKLHDELLDKEYLDKPFWVVYPDHLSYFNKEGMTNLLNDRGLKVEAVVGNNPIDLNNFNANSNYGVDKTKGKNTHYYRVRTDNFLASINKDKLLDIYTTLGEMGVGRDLQYYCSGSL